MSEFSKLAGFLHTLSCDKPHEDDMSLLLEVRDPTVCYYYLEESISPNEERLDHDLWEGAARELCQELSAAPSEVIRLLTTLLDLRRRLDESLTRHPNAAKLARLVLFDVSS